jgi:glycosyltransferase involved in cell wall biosynthesis
MQNPTAVIDLDVTQPLPFPGGVDRRSGAQVLCRLRDRPLGFVHASIANGQLAVDEALAALVSELTPTFGVALAERAIASGRPPRWPDAGVLVQTPLRPAATGPLVTVAVCVRDEEGACNLRACLESLVATAYQPVDVLVVDGSGAEGEIATIAREFPAVRYVRHLGPDLASARYRAMLECRGDILAFTDPDVSVDQYWVASMVRVFLADAGVMAVAGLVVPHELDGSTRELIEAHRFGRGFHRQWYRSSAASPFGDRDRVNQIGAGANMAFWRSALDDIGGFDGDGDLLSRVLNSGHTVVYEPSAIVWSRAAHAYPEFVVSGHDVVRRLLSSAGDVLRVARQKLSDSPPCGIREAHRHVDLADPMRPIADAAGADRLLVTVAWGGERLGSVAIDHRGAVVSTLWLTDAIAQGLTVQVLDAHTRLGETVLWSTLVATLAHALMPSLEKWRSARNAVAAPRVLPSAA